MPAIKKLMAANGNYQKDGEEKTNWVRVGTMFKSTEGKFSIKIEALPIGEWDGWVQLFDFEEQRERSASDQNSAPNSNPHQAYAQAPPADFDEFDDSIPF